MAKVELPRAIYVEWVDAAGVSGWQHKPAYVCDRMYTIGWLVGEDEHQIVIAQTRDVCPDHAPWCDTTAIPKVAIKKRKWVKL